MKCNNCGTELRPDELCTCRGYRSAYADVMTEQVLIEAWAATLPVLNEQQHRDAQGQLWAMRWVKVPSSQDPDSTDNL